MQREGGVWHVSGVTAAANSVSEMARNCEQWLTFVVMAAGREKDGFRVLMDFIITIPIVS